MNLVLNMPMSSKMTMTNKSHIMSKVTAIRLSSKTRSQQRKTSIFIKRRACVVNISVWYKNVFWLAFLRMPNHLWMAVICVGLGVGNPSDHWFKVNNPPVREFWVNGYEPDTDAFSDDLRMKRIPDLELYTLMLNTFLDKPESTFVDVGAELGFYSLMAASMGHQVFAFGANDDKLDAAIQANTPAVREKLSLIRRNNGTYLDDSGIQANVTLMRVATMLPEVVLGALSLLKLRSIETIVTEINQTLECKRALGMLQRNGYALSDPAARRTPLMLRNFKSFPKRVVATRMAGFNSNVG
jgi:hypothetical protein